MQLSDADTVSREERIVNLVEDIAPVPRIRHLVFFLFMRFLAVFASNIRDDFECFIGVACRFDFNIGNEPHIVVAVSVFVIAEA